MLLCTKTIPFQYLSKGLFPLYTNFCKLPLIYFCYSYRVSLLQICSCWGRRRRRGLTIPFSIRFHFVKCCMFIVTVLRPFFLFWNIEILFLLFLFCRPLTFGETICKFFISWSILTHLLICFMLVKDSKSLT